jgi:CRP-like cAMP-binding protein
MFVVLSGKVNLDGTGDTVRSYGPGEVVGLLSTLTGNKYGVTATVSEEAELGFWSPEALDSLLRERPDLCRPLLAILGVRLAEDEDAESVSPPSRLSQPRNSKLI